MENVVYILGAGFSRPAGIPTIKEFLERAKDLQSDKPRELDYFSNIFQKIDSLGHINTFYNAKLKNIEEVLSILEMRAFAKRNNAKDLIETRKFISAVIRETTPSLVEGDYADFTQYMQNRTKFKEVFYYVSFMLGIHKISLERVPNASTNNAEAFSCKKNEINAHINYSIITLNYDRLLENANDFIGSTFIGASTFAIFDTNPEIDTGNLSFSKLHGDAGSGLIISPTWNKVREIDIDSGEIIGSWKLALKKLTSATQIRIIGYSLPENDAYVKYLLKSAIQDPLTLKRIDVICMDDDDKSVYKRYKEIVSNGFDGYRFADGDIGTLLNSISVMRNNKVEFDIESTHANMMRTKLVK